MQAEDRGMPSWAVVSSVRQLQGSDGGDEVKKSAWTGQRNLRKAIAHSLNPTIRRDNVRRKLKRLTKVVPVKGEVKA